MLKRSLLGISLHIYITDVYIWHLPTHLFERCGHYVYPCTSILKMCLLCIYLQISIKDMYTGHMPVHLSYRCAYWVYPCTSK